MKKIFIVVSAVILIFSLCVITDNIGFVDKIEYDLIDNYRQLSLDSDENTILTDEVIVQVKFDFEDFSETTNINIEEQEKYRNAALEYYTSLNEENLSNLNLHNYKSIYISQYSPYIEYIYDRDKFFNNQTAIAHEINVNDNIQMAYIKDNIINKQGQLIDAMYSAGALAQYNDPTYTGAGIRVGILEPGLVDKNAVCFSEGQVTVLNQNYSIESVDDHSTHMAAYIGGSDGIAKDVEIFSAYLVGSPIEEIDWMINNGVNIINMSYGEMNPTGIYSSDSAYCDFVAMQYCITMVGAVGNFGSGTGLVGNPALGYNVIGVGAGGFGAIRTEYSSYAEVSGPPKPTIIARGDGVMINSLYVMNSGTSVACAVVSGIVALLMERYPILLYRPEEIISIMVCSAYQSPYAMYLDCGLNECGGAGLIRYDNFCNLFSNMVYVTNNLRPSGSTIKSFNITLTEGTVYKISAAWLINANGNVVSSRFTNYDLYLYDSQGNVVAQANSTNSNIELITYTVPADGTYNVKLIQLGNVQRGEDRIIICHGEMPEELSR